MKGGLLDLTFVPAKDAAPQTLFSLLSGQKVHTRFFPKLSVFCFKLRVDPQGYCEGVPLGGCAQAAGGGVGLAAQALAGAGESKAGGPNTVLRVIVEHMVYPVTLDVIFQIFSRVGKVMKIVTFTKNNTFQVKGGDHLVLNLLNKFPLRP